MGRELGFQAVGIATPTCRRPKPRLAEWLGAGWHGEMDYMARHGALRARPAELVPGTLRVISCRMDYLRGRAGTRRGRSSPIRRAPTSRATRSAATTTR